MFALHDDKIIAFKNRDVATLLPGLPVTLVEKIESALATFDPDAVTWSDVEHGHALEDCEKDARAEALLEAADAVFEACRDIDPDHTNETATKVMLAAQAAIRALAE